MKTQAMGWLAMAVVAAGMNASYHQGGMRWAHQIVDQVGYRTSAVIALATGNAEQFLAEARLAKSEVVNERIQAEQIQARNEVSSCPFEKALTRVQDRIAHSQERFERLGDRFNDRVSDRFHAAISAREAKERAQVEVQSARMEAQRDRLEAQLAKMRMPAVDVNVVAPMPTVEACPRIRVSVPRIPEIKIPSMPDLHIDIPGTGTI
jgi:hypothetical protein